MTTLLVLSLFTQTYEEAYNLSIKENKPLLIILTSDYCGSCIKLKETLQESKRLDRVSLVFVNIDEQPELAEKLMKERSLPQLILFFQSKDGWKRTGLVGCANETQIQELIKLAE